MAATAVRNSVAAVLGLGTTIAVLVAPSAVVDHGAPVPRAILETAVALIGTLVALLAFGRFRRSGTMANLSIVCAVALLAWLHTLFKVVPDLISPYSAGNGVSERVEIWGGVVVRTVAAGFLLLGARVRPLMSAPTPLRRDRELVPAAAMGFLAVVAISLLVWLVPISHSGLLQQISWPQSLASIALLMDGGLFFLASFLLSRRSEAQSDRFLGWIAAGCVFAGFSMISYALLPAGLPEDLSAGDLLRAAAVGTWAIGAVSEILSYWANIAESARKEARQRAALDLHDGLAQELALLTTYTYAPAAARVQPEWHEQLNATAVRALAEARRAIAALADDPVPFAADLERTAGSISGSDVDIRVEVAAGSWVAPGDPVQRESIVRIVREAVTNAVRHGGASHIDIVLEAGQSPALRILDDGVGFDPAMAVGSGHLGLVSMRERAEAIGASLAVRSAPGEGTTVELLWP